MSFGVACLLITLLFAIMLVIGFFIGFWRGLKKSSLNLTLSVVALLFAFFFTPMITGAVMNIKISTSSGMQTLNNFFVSLITKDASINNLVSSTPSLNTFINALPQALANIAIFLALVILFEFVFYLIYKIFAAIFFGRDKKKENYKPYRFWGGAVGVVKTLLVVMFAFMPITALAKTANNVLENDTSYITEVNASTSAGGILDAIPKQAKTWIKAHAKSPFGFVGGIFGLDNAMFDHITKIELDGKTLNIRQEIPAVMNVYNVYSQIDNASKNGSLDYAKLNFKNIDKVYEQISSSGLFYIVSDFMANYMQNYKTIDLIDYTMFGELTAVFDNVAIEIKDYDGDVQNYFKNDLDKMYNSFKELASSGVLGNVSFKGNALEIVKSLTSQYYATTQSVLKNLFDMNIVRAGIAPIADKAITTIIKDAEKVVIDTSSWTQAKWEELSAQLLNVSSKLHLVTDEIEFNTLLNDPMQLLSADKQYNVDNIFAGIGQIIDELRKIEIFKSSTGKPIVDKLLSDVGFALPTSAVIANDGTTKTITNYQELFAFMLQPFKELKNLDIYTLLSNTSATQTEIFSTLADVCKTDEKALSNIILPLYQVEPTKTLLVDNLLSTFSGELIDFAVLSGYEEWKNDLAHISTLLVKLTSGQIELQSYLEYILGGNSTSDLVLNLTENQLGEILAPMLQAKSTKTMANKILDLSADSINSILGGGNVAINKNATFISGNINDQTTEVCNIFNAFVPIYKEFNSGKAVLEDLNRIELGNLLDSLKLNRYRMVYDSSKTEAGAFADMFDAIIAQIENKYGSYISFKEPSESDYSKTDFKVKMQELDDIISQLPTP